MREMIPVSLDIKQRHKAVRRTEDGTGLDIASLLRAETKLKTLKRAQKLKELLGNSSLARIHANGNGIGKGRHHSEHAAFFHKNRVLLRRAVQKAINNHCPDQGQAPLVPLMLGGDDLLHMSRAEMARPFIVTLCEALDTFSARQ